MKQSVFTSFLVRNNIGYERIQKTIVITHAGNVDLSSLTTLPEDTKFENRGSVYLSSLETLLSGTKFKNASSVYLSSLKTLPRGTKFENAGAVELSSLTSLPADTKFENAGAVYLGSLTTLPSGTKFENAGYVFLDSLSGQTVTYRGKSLNILHVDGYTMAIKSSSTRGETTFMRARYFRGGDISDWKKCFIAEREGYTAHGETPDEAARDVNFKILQSSADVDDIVARVKETGLVTLNDYRLLTGACRDGALTFLAQNNIPTSCESLPLREVLKLTKNAYGGDRMQELFA